MNLSDNFILGRYRYGNTLLHRLDARIKLFGIVTLSLSTVFIGDFRTLAVLYAVLVSAVIFSRIRFRRIAAGIMPIGWIVLFTFILHSIMPESGMRRGALISLKIINLFCWASLLTATTSAGDLAGAIAWCLRPFKLLGISPAGTALTMSLSLRFFPLILEEAQNIIRARKLRKEKMGIVEKLESFCSTFMVRVMKRAEDIELSLKNRGLDADSIRKAGRRKLQAETISLFFVTAAAASYILFNLCT